MKPILKACGLLNETVATFARRLGVKPPTVHGWISGDRPIPPKRALQIERETNGGVSRAELRPKDFRDLWPEFLAQPRKNGARRANGRA